MKPKYDMSAPDYPYKRHRERVARLIAAGLCTACGAVPPREGRRYCPGCAATHRAGNVRLQRLAVECGVCIACRKRAATGDTRMCSKCRGELSRKQGDAHAARPCPKCGGSRESGIYGGGYCVSCSLAVETKAERMRRLVSEGRCQQCGESRGSSPFAVFCETHGLKHREQAREWYRRNRAKKVATD